MTTRQQARIEWSLLRPDERVLRVADRQYGRIAYRQLRHCGLSKDQIHHRTRTGWLRREHRGVFIVGHAAHVPLGREAAALLACGAGTGLNRRSAAIVWGLPVLTDAVDVSVPPHRRPRHEGIRVHRVALKPHEVTKRHGLPVTTAARTLIDIAPLHDADELEHLIAEAVARRLVQRGEVEAIAGRRGAATLRQATAQGPKWTRSHAERVLKRLIRDAGLPEPEMNVHIAGCLVDAVWRDAKVALEVDSWAWHGHRRAFERDHDRDMRLREAGFESVRLTARQLERQPLRCAAHLARLVA